MLECPRCHNSVKMLHPLNEVMSLEGGVAYSPGRVLFDAQADDDLTNYACVDCWSDEEMVFAPQVEPIIKECLRFEIECIAQLSRAFRVTADILAGRGGGHAA